MRKKKQRNESYKLYIYKVLKQIHSDLSISKKAINIINDLICDIYEKIIFEVRQLMKKNKSKRLTSREIMYATLIIFGNDQLGRHAISEGVKAVQRFIDYYKDPK